MFYKAISEKYARTQNIRYLLVCRTRIFELNFMSLLSFGYALMFENNGLATSVLRLLSKEIFPLNNNSVT